MFRRNFRIHASRCCQGRLLWGGVGKHSDQNTGALAAKWTLLSSDLSWMSWRAALSKIAYFQNRLVTHQGNTATYVTARRLVVFANSDLSFALHACLSCGLAVGGFFVKCRQYHITRQAYDPTAAHGKLQGSASNC